MPEIAAGSRPEIVHPPAFTLRELWPWTLFGVAWTFAAAGIVFKIFATGRLEVLSTAAYIAMGWLCIIAVKPMFVLLSPGALVLLGLGGLFYTAGTVFYHRKSVPYSHAVFFACDQRVRYSHAVWHLFVIAGSLCHYLAIALYVLGPEA